MGEVAEPSDLCSLTALLARAGFVAAGEEAVELLDRAEGDGDLLGALVARRLTGEPLAWITGRTCFCGLDLAVDPGVYVPRWQSEPLARRSAERLPAEGMAVDLCTGAGALARVMATTRPGARVVASDIDPRAVDCARRNGVDAHRGDLFDALPAGLEGRVDVVAAVVPYVPTGALSFLPRDTLAFERPRSYDGGVDGADVLRRVVTGAPRYLRRGGALLLELGGDQAHLLDGELIGLGFGEVGLLVDEDGDVRGVEATFAP